MDALAAEARTIELERNELERYVRLYENERSVNEVL